MKKLLGCILAFFLFCFGFGLNNAEATEPINLVFTTDSNYVRPCRVAVYSAILNKSEDSIYNINIIAVDLTRDEQNSIKKLATKNAKINIVPVKLDSIKDVGNHPIQRQSVTRADLFKFFMPELFPNLEKILYIDSDTIILKDLSEVYNTDLKDKYIGVALLRNAPVEMGYNCGVILYNLNKWRKDNITDKLVDYKNNNYNERYMTQGVFNAIITTDNIVILPSKYNKSMKYYVEKNNDENSINDTVILHYPSNRKPWANGTIVPMMHVWWEYSDKLEQFDCH